MKKIITLLWLMLAGTLSYADLKLPNITYIQNTKRTTDNQYQAYLRKNNTAWKNFSEKHGSWYAVFNEENQMPMRAFGTPIAVGGQTPSQKAQAFIQNQLREFNIPLPDLVQTTPATQSFEDLPTFDFKQTYKGLDIINSRLTIRFNTNGTIKMFGLDVFNNINTDTRPTISLDEATNIAKKEVKETITSIENNTDLKIVAMRDYRKYNFALVYTITVKTIDNEQIPSHYYTLVDAHTGKILYRQDRVFHHKGKQSNCNHDTKPTPENSAKKTSAQVRIMGSILWRDPITTPTPTPRGLQYLRATISGNTTPYYSDTAGYFADLPAPTGTNVSYFLDGRWCRIVTGAGGTVAPSFVLPAAAGSTTISFDGRGPVGNIAQTQHLSAYYHVNVVHDRMKLFYPTFTALDLPLTTRIDRTDGNCNAFYDGSSINFYAPANNCDATAKISDVVYHEYGHGITIRYYSSRGQSFDNGAMGEGYADIYAIGITNNPILGTGFFAGNPNGSVRRYDLAPKVYPADITGGVHADGEIIAGAWWNYATRTNTPQMYSLFAKTLTYMPNAPNGDEGPLYVQILLDALTADDNDGNLANGTPNFQTIIAAFARSGISFLSRAEFLLTEGADVQAGQNFVVEADVVADPTDTLFNLYFDKAKVYFKINNDTTTNVVNMLPVAGSGTLYRATLPAYSAGTIISYYAALTDLFGTKAQIFPSNVLTPAPNNNLPYYALVGYNRSLYQDVESQIGWSLSVPTDNSTTGRWIIASPTPSFANAASQTSIVQTGSDFSPQGVKCAVTGNATSGTSPQGDNDVDNGTTTITSPPFDLTGMNLPLISYRRWYTNATGSDPNNDSWIVQISGNGTTWVNVEDTKVTDREWRRNLVKVSNYMVPTATVSMRFIASDLNAGSIVEAAIDDIEVYPSPLGTGIESESRVANIEIYPNPTSGISVLLFDLQSNREVVLNVLNVIGKSIYSKQYNNLMAGEQRLELDTKSFGEGIYFVAITCNGKTTTKRLAVVK